ncbi:MAG: IS1634 family transposase [Chromatiaceae bacterium]|jgi:transposase
MYVDIVPNRKSRPAVLLREGWREGKKVCKRTVANLSDWPARKVELLRRVLRDEPLVSPTEAFAIERSLPHGHVEVVLETIRRIGLDTLIGAKRSRQRDLVLAMIVERLIAPCSKLATTRAWHSTTLAEELAVGDADEEQLYAAMDWLLARQARIENKLAGRHLSDGGQVLYDVSSSYFEGRSCPLVQFGHSRDGKRGRPIVVYGVLTDAQGRPVSVEVYPGNTADPSTVPDQVEKLKGRFGLKRVVLVGDRGMLTQTQIEVLKTHPGIGWISALRSEKVRQLVDSGALQLSLFDEQNLAEIASRDFPGERLTACFNPLLAEERRRKRDELLAATQAALAKIRAEVRRRTRTPLSAAQIGQKVGRVINRHKMGKHFEVTIEDGAFSYRRREQAIAREAQLDGLYVIRTSEAQEQLSAEQAVRSYKNLARVERAFRTLKGMDLRIRPIHHRNEDRVRAHIFLCLLAYYVEWHLRQAWAELLFDDETLPRERLHRDPVAAAKPSKAAQKKKSQRRTEEGLPIHSFSTLMAELGTRCRHRCRLKADPDTPSIEQDTEPTPLQARALGLIRMFPVPGT